MNNKQVAHIWAHQNKEYAKGSNFYFEGDTIYSYGRHFPIAKHCGNYILMTTQRYSSSTSRHISYVRQAASHLPIINVENVDKTSSEIIEGLKKMAQKLIEEALASKTELGKCLKLSAAECVEIDLVTFCRLIGDVPYATPNGDLYEKAESFLAAREEKIRAGRAARDEKKHQSINIRLEQWKVRGRSIDTSGFYLLPPAMRSEDRSCDKFVVTSHRAEVPYEEARQAFIQIMQYWDKGSEEVHNLAGYKIGDFTGLRIASDTVSIGCHTFQKSEVMRFATQEGWI